MKKYVSLFCGLSVLAANCCAMAAVFSILSIVEEMENSDPGLAVWIICLSLCHIALYYFLRKERSERAVILLCAVFFAAQAALVLLIKGAFSTMVGMLAALCMWLYSYYSNYEMAIKALTAEKITKSFDLCSLVLIFALYFCSVKKLPFKMLLPLGISLLLCLFALILIRGGEQRKLRGIFIAAVLVLCSGFVSALFVALASGGVKKILEFITAAVSAVFGFILRMIDAVFRFLASLLPQKQYEMAAPVPTENVDLGSLQDLSFDYIDPQIVISVMIGIGLCIAMAAIIYHIVKGRRFGMTINTGIGRGISRSRNGFVNTVRKALRRLMANVSFRLSAITARNTVPGLFWQIECRSRGKLHGRGKDESCREFLKRAVPVYPWAEAELMQLADKMDALCFGNGAGLSAKEITTMRRAIFNSKNEV